MVLRRSFWRVCLILTAFVLLLWGFYDYQRRSNGPFKLPFNTNPFDSGADPVTSTTDADTDAILQSLPSHPVDQLITHANELFNDLRSREAKDVTAAAAAYRQRRGRHPPPDFGKWVEFAKANNALVIEELFDQIHNDLEPFWAIPPQQLQRSVAGLEYVVSVRNGSLTTTESHDGHIGIGVWKQMFTELKDHLPDVDLAFNVFQEPRLLVPWDNIAGYMQNATKVGRLMRNGSYPTTTEFQPLPPYQSAYYDHHWITSGSNWVLARDTCPPNTPARRAEAVSDFAPPPDFPKTFPLGSSEGYVSNWTIAKDPCAHPHLRGMHGTFIAPKKMKISKDLFPVFGGSKLSMNNDILLPPPEYWTEADVEKSGQRHWWDYLGITSDDWSSKQTKVYWRGPATGGVNRRETWTRFHRHRLVSMMNSTQVEAALSENFPPQNFPLPDDRRPYNYNAASEYSLSEWIGAYADGGFTDLMCFGKSENQTSCDYTGQYFKVVEELEFWEQFAYKYLPDVDGDAFSSQYLALLRSTSLPIKATIFSEWHDSRLIPWVHFVPMDNTLVDFWAVMDYFLGQRDSIAKKIAQNGKDWAHQVLRREDMLVYIYRLVLEYARIMHDNREKMGFVDDLRKA